VTVFFALFVACPLAALNVWPFSNWDLFSRLRTDRQTAWAAVAVDAAGREHGYPITSLPHGYRGFDSLAVRFARLPGAERDRVCAAWLRATPPGTRLVRIYRLDWLLSDRRDGRSARVHRTLAWICSPGGARAVG
jgi:hypothetical protein